jgi:predicted acylesterase/phospholipase RssA
VNDAPRADDAGPDLGSALDPARFQLLRRLVVEEKHRFVVSFGGGSVPALCGNIALAGILEELELVPYVAEVWGTSAGAVVGGTWASGARASEILAALRSLDRFGAIDVSWGRLLWSLLLRPFGRPLPDGLIGGRHFRAAIRSVLRVEEVEQCRIPFRCIACSDDGRMRRKVFRRGPLLHAILCSMSLPGIVDPEPRRPGDDYGCYDGGIVEKTPLLSPISEHQRRGDTRPLLLLATHFGNDGSMVPARGFLNRFIQSIYALEDVVWHHQLGEARARPGVSILLLNPHLGDPALFDFGRIDQNHAEARAAFLSLLQSARLGLALGGA